MKDFQTIGEHILVDVWEADSKFLDDYEWLRDRMTEGALKSGATIISEQHKRFEPNGVTILILLSESHFSIHTYPEKGFASIDCYTCGDTVDPRIAVNHLLQELNPNVAYTTIVGRGKGIHKIKEV